MNSSQNINNSIIEIKDFNFYYGDYKALEDINLNIKRNAITSLIGPSGCGKSTLLKSINRMSETVFNARTEGDIIFEGQDIRAMDVVELRLKIGMVFQRPNPFPKTVFENVAYGPRLFGLGSGAELDEIVEVSLRRAALWDEVKKKLDSGGLELSGGQQQRLCIARALAVDPEVLLMDEPCSALDPASTLKIESLVQELKSKYTIVIVTHNMQQAARVSDFTSFLLCEGEGEPSRLIEYGKTKEMFMRPRDARTERYITGRFG